MRGWAIVLAALLVGGCIPKGARPREEAPRAPQSVQAPSRATLQCQAELRKEGVRFRPLPDRWFANGCSAAGAVQLLDIGTPVTNLGAMTCPVARQFARWAREAVQPAAEPGWEGRWSASKASAPIPAARSTAGPGRS
jgi:hypothetical protein